ncbi:MAG TPA: hypothetical protein VGM88_03230 [Kofleriaceae bacterium]
MAGCSTDLEAPPDASATAPLSVRDRLANETFLDVAPASSAGGVTAEKRASDGWTSADVVLAVDSGMLAVKRTATGDISLDALSIDFAPVALPPSVLGQPATLSGLSVSIAGAVEMPVTWTDDDHASIAASVDLDLSWTLMLDGDSLPLGSPHLTGIPVTIQLAGDGSSVSAAVSATAMGELWSWASLVKLEDLELTVLAKEAPTD